MTDTNMVINITGSSKELESALKNITNSIKGVETQAKKSTTASSKAFKSLTVSVSTLKGALIALGGVAVLKKGFSFAIESAISLESIMGKLSFSSENATKRFSEVSKVADSLGLEVFKTVDSFASFDAAVKGTSLQGQAAIDVFTGVSQAAATLRLNGDKTARAFVALEQMISKGVVSSEDFKGQFAEAIPAALGSASRALGITTTEFTKLLNSGKILAEDFVPKLAKQLSIDFGADAKKNADTLSGTLNHMRFTMKTVGAEVGEGLTPSIKELSTIIKDNKDTLIGFGESLVFIAKGASEAVKGIQDVASFAAQASTVIGNIYDQITVDNIISGNANLSESVRKSSTEISRAGDIIDLKNQKLKSLREAYKRSGVSAEEAAAKIKGFNVEGSKAAASGDLTKFVKDVNTELLTLNKKTPESVDNIKKIKKALTLDKKTEGDLARQLKFFENRNLTTTERVSLQYNDLYARIVKQRGDTAPELNQLDEAYTSFLSQENEKRKAIFDKENNSMLEATRAFKIEQEKISNQSTNGSVIQDVNSSFDQKIAATQAFFEQKSAIENEQFALDAEKRASAFELELESLNVNEEQRVALRQTFQENEAAQKQAHENRLLKITKDSKDAQASLDKQKFNSMLSGTSKALGLVSGLMNSHSRKAFELGKAAAIGKAIVDTASAAMGAYTSLVGIPIVGPVIAPIAAAAAVAVGIQNVNKIRSAKFGGGSAGGATGGTGASIPSAGSSSITPPTPAQQGNQSATVNLTVQALDPSAIDESVLQKIGDKLAPVLQSSFDRGQNFAVQ